MYYFRSPKLIDVEQYAIAYSLSLFEGSITYMMPEAYVVTIGKKGLKYMKKLATSEVLESYDLTFKGLDHEQLLSIIRDLSPEGLETRYNKGKRKVIKFDKLFEDELVRKHLMKRIADQLFRFINIIKKNNFPICFQIERKVFLEDIRLKIAEKTLIPKLSFIKTQTGINYTMLLSNGEEVIKPFEKFPKIVCDVPGVIILGNTIYDVENINANKIKPFIDKDHIFIPERITKTYFEKFILDIITKVDVDTQGFDVKYDESLPLPFLSFTKDFFTDQYVLQLAFQYRDVVFGYADVSRQRVRLDIDEDGKITVYYTKRNLDEENKFANQLQSCGLTINAAKRFYNAELNDEFSLIHWAIKNIDRKQFLIQDLDFDGRVVSFDQYQLEMKPYETSDKDWFDIKAKVLVGEDEISFIMLMQNIKEGNRIYDLGNGRCFIIPEEWMTKYESLAKFGIVEDGRLKLKKSNYTLLEEVVDTGKHANYSSMIKEEDFDFKLPIGLKADLRPYQYQGAKWLVKHQKNGLGACLADDMGLGKTVQTLAALLYLKEELKDRIPIHPSGQLSLFEQAYELRIQPLKALIILPASLVFNWENEIRKFAPQLYITRYTGQARLSLKKTLHHFDIILTTYQIAVRDIAILETVEYNYLVLDESHYIKNRDSKVFGAISRIKSENKLSLSGTPIENSLSDLWSQMQFINPDILGDYKFFKKHFQIPIEKFKDEDALFELKTIVDPFIMRRTRKEVLTDLPAVDEQVHYSEMSDMHKSVYEKEKSAIRNHILSLDVTEAGYQIHVFNAISKLRQMANHPIMIDDNYNDGSSKFNDVIEYIDTIRKSGSKALVFSSYIKHLDLFTQHFDKEEIKYARFTGSDNAEKREKEIHKFNEHDDCDIFFISIKAGGTGLNLTKADYILILDPWWNPFVEEQAIARAHRMGQLNQVNVVRFITKDTIEEKIMKLQEEKRHLASDLLGTEELLGLDKEEINDLME